MSKGFPPQLLPVLVGQSDLRLAGAFKTKERKGHVDRKCGHVIAPSADDDHNIRTRLALVSVLSLCCSAKMQSRFRDWGDARIFLAVAREGSTLAASRVLGINQTTVARRIGVLEHALDLVLFEKTTRGSKLTDPAKRLLPFAEALEEAAMALEAEAAEERGISSGPIRITAFDSAMLGNISDVVADFVEDNPTANFEFIAAERLLDLTKGEADVALRMTPGKIADDRLIAQKLGESCWTYYASRTYADKRTLPDAFREDMEEHCVILLSHVATKRQNVLRCVSGNEIHTAISAGQGIGPLPIFQGDGDPNLVRCFDPPKGSDLTVWLVTSPAANKRSDVRRFIEFAAPRIAQNLKPTLIA